MISETARVIELVPCTAFSNGTKSGLNHAEIHNRTFALKSELYWLPVARFSEANAASSDRWRISTENVLRAWLMLRKT